MIILPIQVFLDSLKEDLNNLKGIFNVCISDMSANSSFASDRIEAAKVGQETIIFTITYVYASRKFSMPRSL